jgi:hypothetical protein
MKQKQRMKEEEKWAKEYLLYRGFEENTIVFEPHCSRTPDFLVDGRIAIEVRRLNQHVKTASGKREPLEELAKPLRDRLKRLLTSMGPPTNGVSWYVASWLRRPQLTKNWEAVVRKKLQPFQSATVESEGEDIEIDRNFCLMLKRAREPKSLGFILAAHADRDANGWAIPKLEKNITLCINEKTKKIAPYRTEYPEWWLVLIDFVLPGMQEQIQVKHDWDKVLVVPPSNYPGAYEVKTSV